MKKFLLVLLMLGMVGNAFANWDSSTDMQTETVAAAVTQVQNSLKAIDGTSGTVPTNVNTKNLQLDGSVSGTITLTPAATAGTTAITVPAVAGTLVTSAGADANIDIGAYDLRAATVTPDGLTSGRVTFATTNGTLTDDADLTFSTATLTATNLSAPTITGVTTLTAGGNLDIGSYELRAQTLQSDVATGTAPLIVASTTEVTNLNADLLDGQTGSYYLPLSNVIFAWNGSDSASTNNFGMVEGSSLTPAMGSYTANYHFFGTSGLTSWVILESKFIKIATISTITINAKLWSSNLGGANDAILTVDIGGQSNEVRSTADDTPTWQPSSTIDVSGLSNGTTYTITISLACEAGTSAYCSAIILTAS